MFIKGFSLSLVPVSMAANAQYIPGASLADKLRLAASKGQVDKVRDLLTGGANFDPDRVSNSGREDTISTTLLMLLLCLNVCILNVLK